MTTSTRPPRSRFPVDGPAPTCPYVGLVPFDENDTAYFFGRDRESEVIVANLTAARLTLLYAPSGVGKSSVLRAGVVPRLRELAEEDDDEELGIARSAVAYLSEWSSAPLEAAAAEIGRALGVLPADPAPTALPPSLHPDWLRGAMQGAGVGTLYLILDQFEEYLFYHQPDTESDELTNTLSEILAARDLNVHVLLSVREDALAGLDRFKGRVPQLFGNYLRLAHLTRQAARSAIEEPVAMYNRHVAPDQAVSVEPALVEELLDQVRTGNVIVGRDGGASEAVAAKGRSDIESPYLQLVLTRLWGEERRHGSRTLRRRTLDELGGAQTIVHSHLDNVIAGLSADQVDVAATIFQHLVTPSGSKIALTAADLAGYSGQPVEPVQDLLETLSSGRWRILRPVPPAAGVAGDPRYEIFHDVMGAAVIDWRRQYMASRQQEMASRQLVAEREQAEAVARTAKRQLRFTLVSVALVVLLLVTAGLAVITYQSIRTSQEQQQLAGQAASRAYAAKAVQFVADDPLRAVALAERALDRTPTVEAEDALRQAMSQDLPTAVLAHGAAVASASFSRQGDRLVTSSSDRTVRVWDSGTGLQRYVRQFDAELKDARFSPDGKSVLALTALGVLTVFQPDSRSDGAKPLATGVSLPVAFNPTGSRVAVTDPDTFEVRIIDPTSGADVLPRLGGNQDTINGIDFSSDGGLVATAGQDGTARVWDTATGRLVAGFGGHVGGVRQVAFRADTGALATGDGQGTVRIWPLHNHTPSGPPIVINGAQTHGSAQVVFDRAGELLAYGDKSPRLFDGTTGAPLRTLEGHRDWVIDARFTEDGQQAITASQDGTARVWDVPSGRELAVLPSTGGSVYRVAVTQAGEAIAVIGATTIGLYRLNERVLHTGSSGWMRDATFLPDGKAVAGGGQDGRVTVWDAASGRVIAQLKGPTVPIQAIDVDRTGRYIVAGTDDGAVWVWDWRQGTVLAHRPLMTNVPDVHFDPTGETLIVAGDSVKLWRWRSSDDPRILSPYPSNTAVFSSNGQYIAVGKENDLELWTPLGTAPMRTFSGHTDAVLSVAFSLDGTRLVSASLDGTARIWRTDDDSSVVTLEGHHGAVMSAAFDDRGSLVVTGGKDGAIGVWDARTGRQLAMIPRHTDIVNNAQFSPGDQPRILSASDDTTVRILDCETCGPLDGLRQRGKQLLSTDERATPQQVAVGQCFPRFSVHQDPVKCTTPHQDEVFAVLNYPTPDDASFPADLNGWAHDQCTGSRYRDYRGQNNADDSEYYTWWLAPRSLEWDLGQHSVICVLTPQDHKDRKQSARR